MILILKNHNEEYAAREIIAAHIPKIKIEISDIIPENGDYVISELIIKDNEYIYSTFIRLEGKEYKSQYTNASYSKTFVKKSINDALKEALGTCLPWGLITGIRPSKMVREMLETDKTENEIQDIFLNHYECSNDKTKLAMEVAKRERALIESMPQNSISLYVGIPFCPTRCLYCSFTSQSIKFSNTLTEPYMDALSKEIAYTANLIREKGLKLDTIYIGGGTPTAISEKQLDRLLSEINQNFDLSNLREYTLEAGRPDTITTEKLKIIRDNNISRISINPQTMNQKTLDIIGRKHSPEDVIRSYEEALKLGFTHINTDLIAGLPEETEDDFIHTINEIKKLNPQSVTIHTMSIKRGSFLYERYSMYTPSASNTVNNMLSIASDAMESLGKKPYYMYRQKNMLGNLENVGYCDTGHECLYNIYIMEEVQSIYAIGAGASTKIIDGSKIDRIFNVKEVSEYIKRIDEMIARKDVLKG